METESNNIPAVEFRNVSLSFDERRALTDINFKLGRAEMIFITGLSGSGKSVLLRLAMALDRPPSFLMQNVRWKLCACLHPGRQLRKD